jgi:hypothetical protein
MKKVSLFFSVLTTLVLIVSMSSCKKTKYGNVVFWQLTGSGYGLTVVSLNGVTSNITSEYSSAPECGASGCAVFNSLEVGSYNYSASDGTSNWSGSIEVTEGCKTMKLY